jgi:hypothetical protein
MFERLVDGPLGRRGVERLRNACGVDGDVRMQLAPIEHRPLEQVQPAREALHAAVASERWRRAPIVPLQRRWHRDNWISQGFLHDGHGKICRFWIPGSRRSAPRRLLSPAARPWASVECARAIRNRRTIRMTTP